MGVDASAGERGKPGAPQKQRAGATRHGTRPTGLPRALRRRKFGKAEGERKEIFSVKIV